MRLFTILSVILLLIAVSEAQRSAPKKAAPRAKAAAVAEQQRQTTQAEDREAIEQLHQDDITGSLALDVDKLVGIWDDEIVAMPPNSKPIVGKEANREYLVSQRKEMANVEILSYEETWDEVRILGEYAYEYGSIRSRIRQVNAKEETPLEFNVMRVLKKQPSGTWKVYRTIWNDRKAADAGATKPADKP
jgi:ketosteroid isomerase-like protein